MGFFQNDKVIELSRILLKEIHFEKQKRKKERTCIEVFLRG